MAEDECHKNTWEVDFEAWDSMQEMRDSAEKYVQKLKETDWFQNAEDNSLRVVDIGCGTGYMLRLLAKEKKVKEVLGVDVEEKMLKILNKKVEEEAKAGELDRSKFIGGEKDMPVGRLLHSTKGADIPNVVGKDWDLLCCINVLGHVREEDVDTFLDNLLTVVKSPGGKLFVVEFDHTNGLNFHGHGHGHGHGQKDEHHHGHGQGHGDEHHHEHGQGHGDEHHHQGHCHGDEHHHGHGQGHGDEHHHQGHCHGDEHHHEHGQGHGDEHHHEHGQGHGDEHHHGQGHGQSHRQGHGDGSEDKEKFVSDGGHRHTAFTPDSLREHLLKRGANADSNSIEKQSISIHGSDFPSLIVLASMK